MYFADCPKCGKPDSSANGFDLCAECQEQEEREKEERDRSYDGGMRLELQEVCDDDRD